MSHSTISPPSAFSRERVGHFFQEKPTLNNQFSDDVYLQRVLATHLPTPVRLAVWPDLQRFGDRVAGDIDALGREVELNPPTLKHYDAWGNRIDSIITSPAWRALHHVSAEEGLVAIGYERAYGEHSRVYQFAKLYLFAASSGLYSCPLAMTDGAARIIETLEEGAVPSPFTATLADAYARLTSRDPARFWTSGQWMTEKRGGSDVAHGTETTAIRQADGSFALHGYKWFTSATDADMCVTLARPVKDASDPATPGTKGLAMFFVKVWNEGPDGTRRLNNMQVQRLKNKLGTRQLPTAELLLDGVRAVKITADGRGVPGIAHMLTITRLHNSINSVAYMRRVTALARDYATKRRVFGKVLADHALHAFTLMRMEVQARASLGFVMDLVARMGRCEVGKGTRRDMLLLRLLVPVAKLHTAKHAVALASEGLECLGGQGYIEDTPLPQILRDAQVLPIWEGTTNVLALDVLRAMTKSNCRDITEFFDDITDRIHSASSQPALSRACAALTAALTALRAHVAAGQRDPALVEISARDFAFTLARTYEAALLLTAAVHAPDEVATLMRYLDLVPLVALLQSSAAYTAETHTDSAIAMGRL
eukprot:CAMPEP_0177639380 /NCGR_PEP_ID=MMETSP0447-20121125/5989_1 /TAXON_ID=0 /ORGANISM="Stygamoeba regulata, Strain BSH-02190019" /LENGTH=595 /DNA_ID=CAMNT_0019141401 /DNA_START=508 /DNA_END=2295 /DNA_ORIENTATION=+